MARKNRSWFLISLTFLFLDLSFGQPDVCQEGKGGYKRINNPRRSVKSEFKLGQSAICDRNLPWGWYRFKSYTGDKMPTKPAETMRCGTVHPIWMRGKHPDVNDGIVERHACINFYGLNGGCFSKFIIKVKNCDDNFFVYYLGPTHSCSLAYCAGKLRTTFARYLYVLQF